MRGIWWRTSQCICSPSRPTFCLPATNNKQRGNTCTREQVVSILQLQAWRAALVFIAQPRSCCSRAEVPPDVVHACPWQRHLPRSKCLYTLFEALVCDVVKQAVCVLHIQLGHFLSNQLLFCLTELSICAATMASIPVYNAM